MATKTRTLIVNAGSSSVKFRLYGGQQILLDGVIDGIGADSTLIELKANGDKQERRQAVKDYTQAGNILLESIGAPPDFIVHRIVHGGQFGKPMVITPDVHAELHLLKPLAPLHMIPSLELIRIFQERTKAVHVAVFDTMFHSRMPRLAKTYAIPPKLAQKHNIQRYGFHGIAYEEMTHEAAKLVGKPLSKMRVVACQLGNGASVCAIKNGRSIDTSMGFTPLEGLIMGTRSGDVDPAIIPFLCEHENLTPDEALRLLQKESGLKALAGEWDVRKLLERERKGDKEAAFALDLLAYRVRKYLGAYILLMGGVDMIVLSGGVPRAPKMRARILSGLEEFGIVVDKRKLAAPMPSIISRGRVKVVVIEVDEQAQMFKAAQAAIKSSALVKMV